jgi:hypothetical protein
LQDALDGDLDGSEAARIRAHLAIAKESERDELASLAEAIDGFLEVEKGRLPAAKPSYGQRFAAAVDDLGLRLDRRIHRAVVAGVLILWAGVTIGYIVVLAQGGANLDSQVVQWRVPLMVIQALVGVLMAVALLAWLAGKEELGLKLAISGFLLSLVALQTLYFYLSQFSAITATLIQLALLLVLLGYRRSYLGDRPVGG